MACQREDLRVALPESSDLRAARAPGMVCLRARSAWRASVEDSCSTMRPVLSMVDASAALELDSPMAIEHRVLPKRRIRFSRTYGDGSVPSTKRYHRRMWSFWYSPRSIRDRNAVRRRSL